MRLLQCTYQAEVLLVHVECVQTLNSNSYTLCSHAHSLCLASAVALLLLTTCPAAALSWPLCDEYGSVWVTEAPRMEGPWPHSNLWFYCKGSLNVFGDKVDACIDSGRQCGDVAADALCQFLGFDVAYASDTVIKPANQSTRSLTGERSARVDYRAKQRLVSVLQGCHLASSNAS